MTTYIIRRLLWLVPVLLSVALITFFLMHTAPGGPWDRDPGARQVDSRTQALLNARFGLDKPLFFNTRGGNPLDSQFFNYVWDALHGDLGPSYRQRGLDVQDILFKAPEGKSIWESRFGYSARLGLLALTISILAGVPLGVISALKRNTWADYTTLFASTIGISVPSFVVAIFLIILFAGRLKLIKIVQADWSNPGAWIIPALVLAFNTTAFVTRLTRATMLDVIQQDYIRTARAKGLSERLVVARHMARNAMIPVVTVLGPALAALVTGSFIIETMFGFPGSGRAFVQSISNRDYSMIMATTLIFAVLVALANLVVDVVYGFLDPRIKLGG